MCHNQWGHRISIFMSETESCPFHSIGFAGGTKLSHGYRIAKRSCGCGAHSYGRSQAITSVLMTHICLCSRHFPWALRPLLLLLRFRPSTPTRSNVASLTERPPTLWPMVSTGNLPDINVWTDQHATVCKSLPQILRRRTSHTHILCQNRRWSFQYPRGG